MAAVGLYRGPYHVVEYMNDDLVEWSGGFDWTGVPVTEAFPEPEYREIQRMMNAVYRTGRAASLASPTGVLWVVPLRERGMLVGVGTHYERRSSQPRRTAVPVLSEQAG